MNKNSKGQRKLEDRATSCSGRTQSRIEQKSNDFYLHSRLWVYETAGNCAISHEVVKLLR